MLDADSREKARALLGTPLDEVIHLMLEQALIQCEGNSCHAAKLLGISRKTIYNRLPKLRAALEAQGQKLEVDIGNYKRSKPSKRHPRKKEIKAEKVDLIKIVPTLIPPMEESKMIAPLGWAFKNNK